MGSDGASISRHLESVLPIKSEEYAMAEFPYRDASLPITQRVDDLIARMTLDEKAALMMQPTVVVGEDGALSDGEPGLGIASTAHTVGELGITHFNLVGAADDAGSLARWHNQVQRLAADTRLGIPVTLSTDPRHHFTDNPATAALAGAFSTWPEIIGLAALRSPQRVREFADVVRQEYTAVGLRAALHPQLDLATEPRWARINNTFGEDVELACTLGAAYVLGLQGEQLGKASVAAMVKHFPGGGPQKDGEDPHFAHGREQIYPGGRFEDHLRPFRAAIDAGVAQVMPYYGMPVGTDYPERGFAFSRAIVTDLLRGELGFDGVVCTDWGIITDSVMMGEEIAARAWGVEDLDPLTRTQLVIEAGCDQFGGEDDPRLISELVQTGRVSEERIDVSVRRLLTNKFTLGLFDDPYVDEQRATVIVGSPDFVQLGAQAQRDAMTLLTNRDDVLPLRRSVRLYIEGIDPGLARDYASVVATPAEAEFALIRLKTPFEQREGFFESVFHSGSLEFPEEEKARHALLLGQIPTVVDMYLDRPAVIPEIVANAAAVLGSYGSDDRALLDVVFGVAAPLGRLPFDLPSSMAAVVNSRTDVAFDTLNPLFRCGHGLRYSRTSETIAASELVRSDAVETSARPSPRVSGNPSESVGPDAVETLTEPPATDSVGSAASSDQIDGLWHLLVDTPRGQQSIDLTLARDGDTVTGDLAGAPLRDVRLTDGELVFRTSLSQPFPVKIKVTAQVSGTTITGSAKAAMLPLSLSFTGQRVDGA
jgi:beta-glucosidase